MVGFNPANFGLPTSFCSRVRSRHTTVRQTDRQPRSIYNAPSLWGRGIIRKMQSFIVVRGLTIDYEADIGDN